MLKKLATLIALAVLVVAAASAEESLFVVKVSPGAMGDIISLDGVNVYAVMETGLLVGANSEGQRNLRNSGYQIVGVGEQQDNGEYFLLGLPRGEIRKHDKRITIIYQDGTEAIALVVGGVDYSALSFADDIVHISFVAIRQIAFHGPIPEVPGVPDPQIMAIVDQVSLDSYAADIQHLQGFVTRWSASDSCRAAEGWALNEFQSTGLDTQMFRYPHQSEFWYDVIGTKVGLLYPYSIYAFIAHIDARAGIQQSIAPGAEDNGSGSALLLEAARVLSQFDFDYTIEFVLVSGEEQGLYGSAAYAQHCVDLGLNIAGIFNFDMVSYSEEPSGWDLYVKADELKPAEKRLAEVLRGCMYMYSDVETVCLHFTNGPEYSSDHYWFSVLGYPAPFASDADSRYAEDFYPWYHSPFDLICFLDLDFGTEVVKGAVATLATLAGVRPDEDEPGGEGNTEYALRDNYPNPFNPTTAIRYSIPVASHIRIAAYNILGQQVAMLVNGYEKTGDHSVTWNASDLPSGTYFIQMAQGSEIKSTIKVLLLK